MFSKGFWSLHSIWISPVLTWDNSSTGRKMLQFREYKTKWQACPVTKLEKLRTSLIALFCLLKKLAQNDNYAFGLICQEVNLAIYFMMDAVKEKKQKNTDGDITSVRASQIFLDTLYIFRSSCNSRICFYSDTDFRSIVSCWIFS